MQAHRTALRITFKLGLREIGPLASEYLRDAVYVGPGPGGNPLRSWRRATARGIGDPLAFDCPSARSRSRAFRPGPLSCADR